MVKSVRVEDAVGKPLAHDVIQYGLKLKAVQFKRGHMVRQQDVEKLKNSGDYFVYVEEGEFQGVHEDEAALRMAKASMGENTFSTKPNKGRVDVLAKTAGLLKVRADVVKKVNFMDGFVIATAPNNSGARKGEILAAMKIVPLSVDEKKMRAVEKILSKNKPVLRVVTPKIKSAGVIVTGTEVYDGRIKDAFLPVLKKKLGEYGVRVAKSVTVPDDKDEIKRMILEFKKQGQELILVCGGMAVDAGDVTSSAIKATGAKTVSRGMPVFPGSMIMLAYIGKVAVLGLPACVIPDEKTGFDLLLPRLLARERITRKDIVELGHGGFL